MPESPAVVAARAAISAANIELMEAQKEVTVKNSAFQRANSLLSVAQQDEQIEIIRNKGKKVDAPIAPAK